ncbi:hypothetical protein C1J01_47870 [Nonomuraea aridisoli]|uniref:Uncharacterized protein n=2 Tax=Nonomuraea aridisoli TaxID=2070368 RepID=A0A2W2EA35_9ACTN|nr:hypothetical protein C1J01_47870 [Nonomuraea aridisoli]
MNEWNGSLAASATDPDALGKASKTAAQKTKDLAGKYDGEVAAALNDLAAGFSTMEGGDMTKAAELTTKVSGFQTKLKSACS